jgi:hypothetical protein
MTMCRAALTTMALVCSLVLAGCASMNEEVARQFQAEMDGYVGRSVDELILARGVPTASAPLSTGGQVLEYSKSQTSISGGNSYATYTPVFVPNSSGGGTWISVPSHQTSPIHTSERSCKLTFQVSADNTVLNWKAEGNDCRPLALP